MKKQFDKQLINKYFQNRISESDIDKVIKWMSEPDNEQFIEPIMQNHWEGVLEKFFPKEDQVENMLNKIHHTINLNQNRERITIKDEPFEKQKPFIVKTYLNRLSRIAAILFPPLLLTLAYFVYKTEKISNEAYALQEYYTPLSVKSKFELSDGTYVWLNSGSKLSYPKTFRKGTREVYLSGEAFFQVSSNQKQPFIVKTPELDITAFGTSFNVMAYPDEETIEATLVEGNIKVEEPGKKAPVYLVPSEMTIYNKGTGAYSKKSVNTEFYTSWKEGKLIFRNESMDVVIRKIERWFNCKILLEDNKLKEYRYTGTIEMETLMEVLELIAITTPVEYEYKKETREVYLKSKN